FGRQQGQQEDGRSARDVMPMEGPNIPNRDGIRKHRAVAIELELMEKRDDRECDGPTEARANDQKSQRTVIEAQALQVHDFSLAAAFRVANLCPERTAFVVR